jgi:hypothetical protein
MAPTLKERLLGKSAATDEDPEPLPPSGHDAIVAQRRAVTDKLNAEQATLEEESATLREKVQAACTAEAKNRTAKMAFTGKRAATMAGQNAAVYTVTRELGHTSPAMVQRVYSHLGTVRHRSEVVEYRVEQHRKVLAERLKALSL